VSLLIVLGGLLIVSGTIMLVFARRLSNRAHPRIEQRNRASAWRLNPWDFSVQAFRLRGGVVVFGGVVVVAVGIALKP
jgi:hypothetical protein